MTAPTVKGIKPLEPLLVVADRGGTTAAGCPTVDMYLVSDEEAGRSLLLHLCDTPRPEADRLAEWFAARGVGVERHESFGPEPEPGDRGLFDGVEA